MPGKVEEKAATQRHPSAKNRAGVGDGEVRSPAATLPCQVHLRWRKKAAASPRPLNHAALSAALILADAEFDASCNVAVDRWAYLVVTLGSECPRIC